jgi:hypothetical protein
MLAIAQLGFGQEVKNIQVTQEGTRVNVRYDLSGTNALFKVSLYCTVNDGKSWQGPLKSVSGDVGVYVESGSNKLIVWDIVSENVPTEGYMQFKVIADLVKLAIEKQTALTPKKEIADEGNTMFDIRRNSINIEFVIPCYGRVFPVGNHFAFASSIGVVPIPSDMDNSLFLGDFTVLIGGPKHMFETGLGVFSDATERIMPLVRFGYRFQGKKGLLVKISPSIFFDTEDGGVFFFPLGGIGYSF